MKGNVLLLAGALFIAACGSAPEEVKEEKEDDYSGLTVDQLVAKAEEQVDAEKIEEAIKIYSLIIEKDAKNVDAYRERAGWYDYMDDYESSISDWKKVVEFLPDDKETVFNLGQSMYNAKMHKEAIEVFGQVIALDSTYANAYYSRGLSYFVLGDREAGCNDLYRADNFGSSEVYFNTLEDSCINNNDEGYDPTEEAS